MGYTSSGGPKGLGAITDSNTPLSDLTKLIELIARVGNFRVETTATRDLIPGGQLYEGLHIYNTTTDRMEYYNGSGWVAPPKIKFGRDAGGTDINGFRTVTHGFGSAPSEVIITDRRVGAAQHTRTCGVESITSTTFAVQYSNAGAAFASNPVEFSWIAIA